MPTILKLTTPAAQDGRRSITGVTAVINVSACHGQLPLQGRRIRFKVSIGICKRVKKRAHGKFNGC